jgi:hypothetical protein
MSPNKKKYPVAFVYPRAQPSSICFFEGQSVLLIWPAIQLCIRSTPMPSLPVPSPPNFSPLHGLSMYTLRAVAPSLEPAIFACFLLADISLGTLSGLAS